MMKNSLLFALCAALPLSLALPTTSELSARETSEEATDQLLFEATISEFIEAREAEDPSDLDWSSDGCSNSPDNPGYDFLNSCYRHDFGYRNYKAQDRFSDDNKDKIDTNFKNDLYDQCETEDNVDGCKKIADIYYWAVSNIGKKRAEEMTV